MNKVCDILQMQNIEKHEIKKNIAFLFRSSCYHDGTCVSETHALKVRLCVGKA